MMSDIRRDLNKAILHSVTGKYALYVFQLVSLAILSRLFTPEIFGVIASFQVFIMFFQLLATSGLSPAIIYQEKMTGEDRDGVFSVTFIIGVIGAIVFYLLMPFIAKWLQITDLTVLILALSFNVLFSSLAIVPMASLQKDTKFILIARAEIVAELASLLISVLLYYKGYGIEALASKLLIVPVVRFAGYYLYSSVTSLGRAKFGSKLSAIVQLVHVAKFQLGFSILNFFSRNLDTILITKYFGTVSVGLYEKSYQVMRYPLQLFTFAITPALQPVLTKYIEQPEIVKNEFYSVAFKLGCVGFFAAMVLFWSANDVVYLLFGPQWHKTAEILRVLAVTIPLQMVLSSTGGVFQAFGATKKMFLCGIFSSITNVSAIVTGVIIGDIKVLCLFLTISFSVNYFQCFYILHKHIFNSFDFKNFLLLTILILLAYINLFFLSVNIFSASTYIDAFCNTAKFSSLVFIAMLIFLFFCRRFKLVN